MKNFTGDPMKTVITFIAGAILASALVYFAMSRNNNAPEAAKMEAPTVITPAPGVASPVESPVPATVPEVSEPASRSERNAKPSAMPRKESVGKPKPASPAKSDAPAAQQPVNTAQNTPSTAPQSEGPIIPYDPLRSAPPPPDEKKVQPKREPKTVTIPAGTLVTVRVDEALSTNRNRPGDSFKATLDSPLVSDGFVIAERGSRVEGRIAESDPGGRVRGVSQLGLELVRLNTSDGQRVRLQTESFTKQGEKSLAKDATKVGIAAGIGAAIGAIAGGGKGAAIGAGVGGAAGTGGVMATRGAAAQIPAETRVSFRLRDALTITERIQ